MSTVLMTLLISVAVVVAAFGLLVALMVVLVRAEMKVQALLSAPVPVNGGADG